MPPACRIGSLFVCVGLAVACGPHDTKVQGDVKGHSLTNPSAGSSTPLEIVVGEAPNACPTIFAAYPPKSAGLLRLTLLATDASDAFVVPHPYTGTYKVIAPYPNERFAQVIFEEYDDICHRSDFSDATSGTVTIDSVGSDNVVQGTFDLQFGADHLTGSFNAPPCLVPTGPATCE